MQDRDSIVERLKRKFQWAKRDSTADAVIPVTLRRFFDDGSECCSSAIGTAFIVNSYSGDGWFLVSNYHNLSGCDLSGKPHGRFVPNVVDIQLRTIHPTEKPDVQTFGRCTFRYRLLDDHEAPLYYDLTHDEEEAFRADIAILPIMIPKMVPGKVGVRVSVDHQVFWELNRGADVVVGEDCFVIGYPRGLQGDGRYPIWKRASVASEPINTYKGKLAFLVDTATREGMSGSPVIARKPRDVRDISTYQLSDLSSLFEDRLVGVYSGREGVDELGVQLGVVWHSELIEVLISKIGRSYTPETARLIE
jgi:hypothetical protein